MNSVFDPPQNVTLSSLVPQFAAVRDFYTPYGRLGQVTAEEEEEEEAFSTASLRFRQAVLKPRMIAKLSDYEPLPIVPYASTLSPSVISMGDDDAVTYDAIWWGRMVATAAGVFAALYILARV